MIYIIVFLFLLFPVIKFEAGRPRHHLTKGEMFFFCVELIVLILLAGLRNGVGGDTFSYIKYWELGIYPKLDELDISSLYLAGRFGPVWYILNGICFSISDQFFLFQLVHSIILNLAIFIFIKKYCNYPFTMVVAYFFFFYLYYNMEIMRQSLGNVVVLFSIPLLIKHKWIPYFFLSLLAFACHNSLFICFVSPFIYILLNSSSKYKYVYLVLVLLLSGPLMNILSGLVPNMFDDKYVNMKNSTVLGDIHVVVLTVLYYIVGNYVEKEKLLNKTMKTCFDFFVFFNVVGIVYPIFMTRYTTIFTIGLCEVLITYLYKKRSRAMFFVNLVTIDLLVFTTKHYFDVQGSQNNPDGSKFRFYQLYHPYFSIFDDNIDNDRTYIIRRQSMIQYNENE